MKSLVVIVALLGGCDLYWNTNNGDDVCAGGAAVPGDAGEQLRDPQTGQCESLDLGGGGCAPCGPCEEDPPVQVDWPTCPGSCEVLGETACLAASGCHAAYLDSSNNPASPDLTFWGCWETAPSGPVEGGGCTALDAQDCSRHDDCIEIYSSVNEPSTSFESCAAEPGGACGNACPTGTYCSTECTLCDAAKGKTPCQTCTPMCVPDQPCDNGTCPSDYQCEQVCPTDSNVCSNVCVPSGSDPGTCTTATCNIVGPACPTGTTAGVGSDECYTGYCIPNTDCSGGGNPGDCTGSGIMCGIEGPACPTGTVAGILDGCWSGYCIPDAACATPACEALTSEAACTARTDCLAIYNGMNCTCEGNDGTCTCESETYVRCETLMGL